MRSGLLCATASAALASALAFSQPAISAEPVRLDAKSFKVIATVDIGFQSYNVEMAEVIGGKFWKPYAHMTTPAKNEGDGQVGNNTSLYEQRKPVDLSNPRLRALAAALSPAYIRVSGSWANTVYFHDSDGPAPATVPAGFNSILTRAQWRGVVEFAKAVNAKLTTSFTISPGVRDTSGVWTSAEAKPLMDYTKSLGGEIVAAELFNEPNFADHGGAPKGYNATVFAKDIAAFKAFAAADAPAMKVVGPGAALLGTALISGSPSPDALMSADPRPTFDIFSYHFYGAVSQRCAPAGTPMGITAAKALSEDWLGRTETVFANAKKTHDTFAAGTPIWLNETAEAACGGDPFATTFTDSFRYVDQMGRLAKLGVAAIFHNTLAASEYALIDQETFDPRPNYWSALLWHKLMGTVVLDAGPLRPGLHIYAQCLKGKPHGVGLVALNMGDATETLALSGSAEVYGLSAPALSSQSVYLNGRLLKVGANNRIPSLTPIRVKGTTVKLAPKTITFIALPEVDNASCH